mgnify:CR=1 FL=1
MQVDEILSKAGSSGTVKRVFGEPIERDGVTIVPVARIMQGGGGGEGGNADSEGGGGGFGIIGRPVGVYRIEDGEVTWVPAVDVTRIALGGQIVGIVALLVFRSIFKRRRRG